MHHVLKHAGIGELHLRIIPGQDKPGVEIIAVDRGPGFQLDQCLTDGYSTGGTKGIGSGALARLAQVFDAYSDRRGSVVLAQLFPRGSRPCAWRFGVSQHPIPEKRPVAMSGNWRSMAHAAVCWCSTASATATSAQQAARAGAEAFGEAPFDAATSVFRACIRR